MLTLGVVILSVGFLYEVFYAGIPYPDPTPEQAIQFKADQETAWSIMQPGFYIILLGVIGLVISLFRK